MQEKIGILDPDGININPLNNKKYSEEYKILAKKWSQFPAYKNAEKTIENIKNNNVISIISGTGSGKTVLIPKFTLHAFNYKSKIAIILPKQILTENSAEFAATTLDVDFGVEVGYKHRSSKKYDKEKTKLLYTTDGTLVAMLLSNPMLEDFDAVIIDEAHERRTSTDFLLYLLKQTCIKRPNFKLIIMSATIDETIFSNYFKELKYISMNISGKTNYPITHVYSKINVGKNDYIQEGIKRIEEILKTTQDGDILFFVPNINETFNACKQISNNENFCVETFSGMSKKNEELAIDKDLYKEKTGKKRKIVVATSVAESSLTIDGIKYIIDSGYENYSYYDPDLNSKVIEKKFATQAQIKQRCGRTGRTGYGICYHLYTANTFDKLEHYPKPSIQTSDIHNECLSLLRWENIRNFDNLEKILLEFIEPPKKEYIKNAREKLLSLNLIDNNGMITKLGEYLSEFNEEPEQVICFLSGWLLDCCKEILIIFIMIEILKYNIDELFYFNKSESDKEKMEIYATAKKSLFQKNSDHYSLLKIFKKYKKMEKSQKNLDSWLDKHYLKKNIFEKVDKYYKKAKRDILPKIKKYFKENDISQNNEEEFKEILKTNLKKRIIISLACGLKSNIAKMTKFGYKTEKINVVNISRDSWLSNTESKMILYSDILTMNNQSYMQIISKITSNLLNLSKKIIYI
jgi:HrpA-like RNA helicase